VENLLRMPVMLSSRENKPVALSREAGIIWKKLHKIKTKLTKGKK